MANSAFVVPRKWPGLMAVKDMILQALADKFPSLEVAVVKGGWLIRHPSREELSFHLWVVRRGKKEAIQIPHRHACGFMWWVEYEVRERLAREFDARQYDEGAGAVGNCSETYDTYSDYLRGAYQERAAEAAKLESMNPRRLPKDLRKMLGDLF